MRKITSFKEEFTFDERLEESRDIIAKYPDRLPVVVERYSKTDLPQMEKKKYMVPRDMSVGQFIHILSSRLQLAPGKALFVFVKNTLPQTSSLMESVYESYKDEDGFLYMATAVRKHLAVLIPRYADTVNSCNLHHSQTATCVIYVSCVNQTAARYQAC